MVFGVNFQMVFGANFQMVYNFLICFNIDHTVLSEMLNRLASVSTMTDLLYSFSIDIFSNSLQTVNRKRCGIAIKF